MTGKPVSRALRRTFGLAAGAVMAALLAGCVNPAPFAPRAQGGATGYTDRELTQTRYRVTFTGNSVTNRETVENYLLLRAAQVAQAAGYGAFLFDTRTTRARTQYTTVPDFAPGPRYGGPFGAGFGGGFGTPGRAGFWGGGYWGGLAYDPAVDVIASTRFEAYAEIVLLTPDQAAHEPRAVNAAEVITHLGPDAVTPPKKT